MNLNTTIAKDYHEISKHSPISIYSNRYFLDWDNKPSPFKSYKNLKQIVLPKDFPHPNANALDCLEKEQKSHNRLPMLELPLISQILFFSAGITRILKFNNAVYYMRASSATGALYPIEIYLSCAQLPGLTDGIYHFCPADFTLNKLYEGDFKDILYQIAGENITIKQAPITLIFTSIGWRNSWKYQTRSYRHWFWDAGTIISNYLALCNANSFSTEIILGFQDEDLNKLLGLKKREEAAILLSPLYENKNKTVEKKNSVFSKKQFLEFETVPLSKYEIEYPKIWELHEGSSLKDRISVKKWNKLGKKILDYKPQNNLNMMNMIHAIDPNGYSLKDVILKRGSTRKFSIKSITKPQLEHILYLGNKPIPFDFVENYSLLDTFIIVNSVKELESGSYFYNKNSYKLHKLEEGNFRKASEHLCLDQELFGNASVICFFMANLDKILSIWGNRGYRAVQLEGGIRIGKMYLAAYAHNLGASGSTFYDDEVTNFFLPHSLNQNPIT
ncbi:MAG: SagB/ThcOx family dehydrogenase, partial [Nitrososphaeraceae archaeon]|nr:SagB/ThcOx family dehydrogenase [Nitrososphaeraceae archaeon]